MMFPYGFGHPWAVRGKIAAIALLLLNGTTFAQTCDAPREAVRFRTENGRYLSAVTGVGEPTHGGYGLAAANVAVPGAAETFFLNDSNAFVSAGREVSVEVADDSFRPSGKSMRVLGSSGICTQPHPVGDLVINIILGLDPIPLQVDSGGCVSSIEFGGSVLVNNCCFSNHAEESTFIISNYDDPQRAISNGDAVFISSVDALGFVVDGDAGGALVAATALTKESSTKFTIEFVTVTNGGPVTGKVIDAANGKGIGGATVSAPGTGLSATTGSGGGFTLADNVSGENCIAAGQIDVAAMTGGYHDGKATTTVAAGGMGSSVTIPLDPCAALQVIVTNAADRTRIAGATVQVNGVSIPADPSGQVKVAALCVEGETTIRASAPCFLGGQANTTVPHTGTATVTVPLSPDPGCEPESVTLACDTAWETWDGFMPLGTAQQVCLNDNSPTNCPALATRFEYDGSGWLAGDNWIWAPGVDAATAPAFPASFRFSHDVPLPQQPASATITVAADDFAEVYVNNSSVGRVGDIADSALAGQASTAGATFAIHNLKRGMNNISIVAKNGEFGCSAGEYRCNPAGLLCHVEINF